MQHENLKIKNLVKNGNTVIILGAGASFDYGFPLWGNLRILVQEHLELIINKKYTGRSSDIFTDEDIVNLVRWRDIFTETDWSIFTIDEIIYKNGEIKDSILKIINIIISNCEANDEESDNKKWIEIFAKKISDYLISNRTGDKNTDSQFATNFFGKIKIITLNYDRSFEYHFRKVFKKHLEIGLDHNDNEWKKYYEKIIWIIFHPHGAVYPFSTQDKNNYFRIFSDITIYKNTSGGGGDADYGYPANNHINIAEVDDLQDGVESNIAYQQSNTALSTADTVVIIGVSALGISKSHLKFSTNSDYFISNKDVDGPKIKEKILSKNQTYLDMYCDELIELI